MTVVFLQILSLAASALTAAKLFRSGLYRRYRIFFAYLLFRVPYVACSLSLDARSAGYFWFWSTTQPLVWLLYLLVVLELYRLILERHRGLYTAGRWAVQTCMAISVIISIASLLPRFTPSTPQVSKVVGVMLAIERGVDLSLALFIVLMLLFLAFYAVPLSRNVSVHAILYAVFFLSNTLVLLVRSLFGMQVHDLGNLMLTGVSAGCTFGWLFLLTPKGEEVWAHKPLLGAEMEERILYQLDTLNSTLLKVTRK